MGHDIYAYRKEKLAYYRASAFCKDNSDVYNALGVPQYNGGVSGIGRYHNFGREHIQKALEDCEINKWEHAANFFRDMLKNCDDTFLIYFG